MITAKTSNGSEVIFSIEDADIAGRSWNLDKHGYARTTINRKPLNPLPTYAHHLVCDAVFKRRPDWSKREVCDHINGNKLDNRRENLRIVSNQQNSQHRKAYAFRGTTFHKKAGKWQAMVTTNGKAHYCGLHENRVDAAKAAQSKREELQFLGSERSSS